LAQPHIRTGVVRNSGIDYAAAPLAGKMNIPSPKATGLDGDTDHSGSDFRIHFHSAVTTSYSGFIAEIGQ
jgi:hypothetical protein